MIPFHMTRKSIAVRIAIRAILALERVGFSIVPSAVENHVRRATAFELAARLTAGNIFRLMNLFQMSSQVASLVCPEVTLWTLQMECICIVTKSSMLSEQQGRLEP